MRRRFLSRSRSNDTQFIRSDEQYRRFIHLRQMSHEFHGFEPFPKPSVDVCAAANVVSLLTIELDFTGMRIRRNHSRGVSDGVVRRRERFGRTRSFALFTGSTNGAERAIRCYECL